jgi:hypothetical protein
LGLYGGPASKLLLPLGNWAACERASCHRGMNNLQF